jgi:DNA repair exonuclease SbcCD ATPase subunit
VYEEYKLAQKQYAVEADFAHLIGNEGFLGSIFEECLIDISTTANAIMQRINNIKHVSLRFSTEKETKSGKVYKKITPIINVGGYDIKPEAGLSGGMYTAVELAVDLAVSQVVASRKGHYPQWLILDEAIYGFESESCLEILEEFAKDRLILVIDHSTKFQNRFSQVIQVENLDGQSVVK